MKELIANSSKINSQRTRLPDRRPSETFSVECAGLTLPYRLSDLNEAIALDRTVFVVEGERKVDALANWNVPATCSAAGAKKWKPEHFEYLRGADVVILPRTRRG